MTTLEWAVIFLIVPISFGLARAVQMLAVNASLRLIMRGKPTQSKGYLACLIGVLCATLTALMAAQIVRILGLLGSWHAVAVPAAMMAYSAVVFFQASTHFLTVAIQSKEELPF